MSLYIKKYHPNLDNFYLYLEEHFALRSYDSDDDVKAVQEDFKYISKRLKKLDRIEKIFNNQPENN
jgi:hypothetical protein